MPRTLPLAALALTLGASCYAHHTSPERAMGDGAESVQSGPVEVRLP